MVRKYDSMVIFERPVEVGSRNLYGVLYSSDEMNRIYEQSGIDIFRKFAEYVVGMEYWLKIGGGTSKEKDYWKINNSYHHVNGDIVKDFCKVIYDKHPLNYEVIEKCYPKYFLKDIDDQYIINDNYKLWLK